LKTVHESCSQLGESVDTGQTLAKSGDGVPTGLLPLLVQGAPRERSAEEGQQ
jgi:hypothetical protein